MPRIKEPLSGGVVNINDPAELKPGELSEARNCHYLPGPGSLQKARGRARYGQVSATAVDLLGLRDAQYDNGDHYLYCLASGGNIYQSVVSAQTGTWALGTGVGGGTTLEAVQYQNRFFLFTGANTSSLTGSATAVNSNQVAYMASASAGTPITYRQHGMLPVVSTPSATTAGGGVFSSTTTGYYEYWLTEVAKMTADGRPLELEGTFSGNPATVFVSATSVVPTVRFPAVRNTALATHWRVYRSAAKASASQTLFPAGFQLGTDFGMSTALTSFVDSIGAAGTTASASALPTTWNASNFLYSDMAAQASTLTAADGIYGTMAVPGGSGGKWQAVDSFIFNSGAGFVGNIAGIQVEIKGHCSGAGVPANGLPIQMTIGAPRNPVNGDFGSPVGGGFGGGSWAGAVVASKGAYLTATTAAPGQVITFGNNTDTWVPSNSKTFTSTDFAANNRTGIMAVIYTFIQNTCLFLDYIKMTVTYGGVNGGSTVQFPQVVYVFGDTSAQVGKHGPPPTSNTGDMFQDQLVVNDVNSPSTVRYSYAGLPESFPSTYYIDFQTRENDNVRCIKNVNGRLVVWLDSSTWRANYLPSERDASFDRGKAIEAISKTYGAVNNMCVCTFSMVNQPELAAWVSNQGIHMTDGFSFKTLTDGLDWTTISPRDGSTYTPIALVNDRDRHQLLYYFRNDSYGAEKYMCLPLCYHQSHLQGDPYNGYKPKVGGLIHMRNYDLANNVHGELKSAWAAPSADGSQQVYLGYGGDFNGLGGVATAAGGGWVYVESSGSTFPAQDPNMSFKTRRMYLNEPGGEWEAQELYGYVPTYSLAPTTTVSYTPMYTKTNDSGESQGGAKTISLGGQRLHKVNFRQMAEGLRVSAMVSASAYAQEYLVIDAQTFGQEDSGR